MLQQRYEIATTSILVRGRICQFYIYSRHKQRTTAKRFCINYVPPSTVYINGMPLAIGSLNLILSFILLIVFLCRKQIYYARICNRYTSFFLPLCKMDVIFVGFRLIPEIMRYCMNNFALFDNDYFIQNNLAFTEWFGLMMPSLFLIFDRNFLKYIVEKVRRTEYELI